MLFGASIIRKALKKYKSFRRVNDPRNNFSLSTKTLPVLGFDTDSSECLMKDGIVLLEGSRDCWELWRLKLKSTHIYLSLEEQLLFEKIPLVCDYSSLYLRLNKANT